MDRKLWIYDIETLKSCFTYTAINVDTQEIVQFVLHKDRFELNDFMSHLFDVYAQVGFNNLSFDYPIIHYIMCNSDQWSDDIEYRDWAILDIYEEAQRIINIQNIEPKQWSEIQPKDVLIKQLDLFKLWHYNNPARSTSLKALEISMNFPNVIECRIPHDKEDITLEEVKEILNYNLNDVLATLEFYNKSRAKIDLRKELAKKFGIPCINWSDSKIGEQLILKLYCDKTGKNKYETNKLRTFRKSIDLSKCILNYIKFESVEFTKLLDKFKSTTIQGTKGEFAESVIYKGFKYDYGTGGIECVLFLGN